MRSSTILLLLAVCFCVLSGVRSRTPKIRCPTACTREYKPVCATWRRGNISSDCTFANLCTLNVQRCRTGQDWIAIRQGPCKRNSKDCRKITG